MDCYYLLLRDSIDEMMWGILEGKTRDVGQMLDGCKSKLAVSASFVNPILEVNVTVIETST